MDNKLIICLQIGLAGFLAFRPVAPVGAQEVSRTPLEQSVTPADERNPVSAKDEKLQDWAFHAQTTFVYQYHPAFTSPYQGTNSLTPSAQEKETFDLTLYGGVRLWKGAEFWVNPEIDQGFGLSDTLGVAGFPSGEAYKVGSNQPYGRVHRAFLRQTVNLGAIRSRSTGTSIGLPELNPPIESRLPPANSPWSTSSTPMRTPTTHATIS